MCGGGGVPSISAKCGDDWHKPDLGGSERRPGKEMGDGGEAPTNSADVLPFVLTVMATGAIY